MTLLICSTYKVRQLSSLQDGILVHLFAFCKRKSNPCSISKPKRYIRTTNRHGKFEVLSQVMKIKIKHGHAKEKAIRT